jgi:hypothetical protein
LIYKIAPLNIFSSVRLIWFVEMTNENNSMVNILLRL